VLAGSLVALALIAGLSAAVIGFIQATQAKAALKIERDAAESARADAEEARLGEQQQRQLAEGHARAAQEQATRSDAVAEFMQQMLAAVDPSKVRGREITVRYVLDDAAERINEGALAEQPEVEAAVRITIGDTYESLGRYKAAETHLREAESIRRNLLGDDHPDTLRARSRLAGVVSAVGNYSAAEKLYRGTVEAMRRTLGHEHPDTLTAMNGLGISLWRQGKYVEAEDLHRRTLNTQRRVLGPEHVDTIKSLTNLGTVLLERERFEQAEMLLQEAMETNRRVHGEEHPGTMTAMNNLALTLERRGKYAEAEKLYRRALELDQRVLGANHPQTQIPLGNLMRVLRVQSKWEETRPYVADMIAQRKAAAEEPGASANQLNSYAWLLLTAFPQDLRDPEAALPVAQKAVELTEAQDPLILDTLALAYESTGDIDQALNTQKKALSLPGEIPMRAELEKRLADLLWKKGKFGEACRVYGGLFADRVGELWFAKLATADSLLVSAQRLIKERRYAEAEPLLRKALAIRRKSLPEDHRLIAEAMSVLGAALTGQGLHAQAEPLILEAYKTVVGDDRATGDEQTQAHDRVIEFYESWGKPREAAKWREAAKSRQEAARRDRADG
jgi:tetratricopeptide (TPR) repeat protein